MSSRPRSLPNWSETLSLSLIPSPAYHREGGSFVERQDANISASQGAETVLPDQPPRREESADEYRRRAGPMRVSAGREKPQATTFALPALL